MLHHCHCSIVCVRVYQYEIRCAHPRASYLISENSTLLQVCKMNFHLAELLITIRTKFQKLSSSTIPDNSPMSTQNNVNPSADPLCGREIASNDMLQRRHIKKISLTALPIDTSSEKFSTCNKYGTHCTRLQQKSIFAQSNNVASLTLNHNVVP